MIRNILIGASALLLIVFAEIVILILKGKAFWSGLMLMYLKHLVCDWTVFIVFGAWVGDEVSKHFSLKYKMKKAGFN